MRERLVLLVVGSLVACGGAKTSLPRAGGGPGNEDLHIPAINPALCDPKGKKLELYDLNRDGKPDVWKLVEEKDTKGPRVDIMTCKQVDLNHDGKKDYLAQYDENGAIILEEYDFDFDGHFDARLYFDRKSGKKLVVERMSGFGEQPDVWEKYGADETLETVRRDRNGDGKPDYWEQYLAGALDKILYDEDFDGKVDRKEDAHPARDLGAAAGLGAASSLNEETAESKPAPESAPAVEPASKRKPK